MQIHPKDNVLPLHDQPLDVTMVVSYRNKAKQKQQHVVKQEPMHQDICNSPFHDRAVSVYEAYRTNKLSYHSRLPAIYSSFQAHVVQKFDKYAKSQMDDVKELYVTAFVIGADPVLSEKYGQKPRDLPIRDQVKENVVDAVAYAAPLDQVQSYLRDWDDHPRHRLNAKLCVEHELNWMSSLAHREGALYTDTQSSKQPSP